MTNAIIASTSTLFGGEYLEYLIPELEKLFAKATTILFVPFRSEERRVGKECSS